MLNYDIFTLALGDASEYCWKRLEKKRQCVYSLKVKGGCVQGCKKVKRSPLKEVSRNARVTPKAREIQIGCQQCGVALCVDRSCFIKYHALNTST